MRDHEFEVDRATVGAWREFQAQLADRLAALEEDDVVVVEAMVGEEPEAGAAPYVQFCAFGDGMLRGEVASNHVLDERWELGAESVRALGELGWAAPTYAPDEEPDHGSLNHYVDVEQSDADRLAVMATRALRDVFGVPHPALLTGDVAGEVSAPAAEGAAAERADEALAAFPHGGHEELTAMVDRALTPYFGHEPRHDSDGDIPVTAGLSVFFVRVAEDVPVVELFGCVATEVTDPDAARREVEILNRDVRFAKFRVSGGSVVVECQLPAWPFVPEHLRAMVAMLTDMITKVEDDLVERVGGRHLLDLNDVEDEDEAAGDDAGDAGDAGDNAADESELLMNLVGDDAGDERDRSTYAELVLAQLNAEKRGSVDPELAASICGHDADVILDLIRRDEQEEIGWRQARDAALEQGDLETVTACDSELRHAAASTRLLRRALRVVVEREATLDAARAEGQAGRQPPRRRSLPPRPSRPRTVPDPTIEEVDPDIWG
jgi:hypothetical protein